MQHELDHISNWCDLNYMKLNPNKCKELTVNFQRNFSSLPKLSQLTINGTMIETVTNHKLLGLQIQDDLKWHIPHLFHSGLRMCCVALCGIPD